MTSKYMALPEGMSENTFDAAIAKFKATLGEDNVMIQEDLVRPYSKIMMAVPTEEHVPSAVVTATTVEQVQQVVKICNEFKVPVWTISTGRNFGYGSAAPVQRGQIILDLRKMNKILHIEALTMSDMVREEITPACIAFEGELAATVNSKKAAGVSGGMEAGLLSKVSELTEELYAKSAALDEAVAAAPSGDNTATAHYYHDTVIAAMDAVRAPADKLEGLVGKKFWPFPTYSDILFYV